jgi:hypothetical protein
MKFLKKMDKDFTLYIEKILVALFLVSILIIILRPIHDPDVFWHLKSGEWIWQHKALPDTDPFSFTVDAHIYEDSKRPYYILKGYWLSQLIIYGFYSFFGIYGIIIFRCLIYLGLIFLLYFWMRQREISLIITLLFLIPSLFVVFVFQGERPNTLSYLMAVIIFYILDEYISAGKRKGLLLPVFMLIWSAMHGGFLLGEVLIGIYLIVMIYRLLKRELSFKTDGFKILTLFISIVLPFLIKGNWNTVMMKLKESLPGVAEQANPFIHARLGEYGCLVLLVFMVLFIFVIIKKLSIEHVLIAIFLIVISFNSIRYIPFLVLLMTPIVSLHWTKRPTFDVNNRLFRYSIYTAIFFSVIFLGQKGFGASVFLNGIIHDHYPVDAVKFIKTVKPEGNMFNPYAWGGFLIYSLYPEKKVFIDPRGLSLPVLKKYNMIILGNQEICHNNIPMWKAMLYEYNIEMVLLPTYKRLYKRVPVLIKRLVDDPEWSLVFVSNKSPALIFLKNTTQNQQLIQKYSVIKKLAYEKAVEDLMNQTANRVHWRNDLQIGLLNIFLKRYSDSSKYFEKALEKNSTLAKTSVSKVLREIKNSGDIILNDEELYEIWGY